jgi:alcohol dehydrogenase class IV
MLDALCQGIESWWSVNSTDESKRYSKIAIQMIIENWKQYIYDNIDTAAEKIMLAANYSGRAINITQTTAAHAMSYMLTSTYKLPHGHAVAVCLPEVWDYMNSHTSDCIDNRGSDYLKDIFSDISKALKCSNRVEAVEWFRDFLLELEVEKPTAGDREAELKLLTESVNPLRLKNNPVALDSVTLRNLYERILK